MKTVEQLAKEYAEKNYIADLNERKFISEMRKETLANHFISGFTVCETQMKETHVAMEDVKILLDALNKVLNVTCTSIKLNSRTRQNPYGELATEKPAKIAIEQFALKHPNFE